MKRKIATALCIGLATFVSASSSSAVETKILGTLDASGAFRPVPSTNLSSPQALVLVNHQVTVNISGVISPANLAAGTPITCGVNIVLITGGVYQRGASAQATVTGSTFTCSVTQRIYTNVETLTNPIAAISYSVGAGDVAIGGSGLAGRFVSGPVDPLPLPPAGPTTTRNIVVAL